jgi:hypothetical protein
MDVDFHKGAKMSAKVNKKIRKVTREFIDTKGADIFNRYVDSLVKLPFKLRLRWALSVIFKKAEDLKL